MQNYKDVCGNNKMVWFEIKPRQGKAFLVWAKSLGCVWMDGKDIRGNERVDFFHLSIDDEGKVAFVPAFAWISASSKNVPKYDFGQYIGQIDGVSNN